jgi:uncharacterized membrane protein YbhN (UPF0104 family)
MIDADLRLVHNVRLQLIGSCFQLVIFLLDAATLWMLIRSLGATAHLSHVFASFMISNLVRTVSFIPGGLGTFEAAAVLMLKIDGVSVAGSVHTTLVSRAYLLLTHGSRTLVFSSRQQASHFVAWKLVLRRIGTVEVLSKLLCHKHHTLSDTSRARKQSKTS